MLLIVSVSVTTGVHIALSEWTGLRAMPEAPFPPVQVLCLLLFSRKSRDAILVAAESRPDFAGLQSLSTPLLTNCSCVNEVSVPLMEESLASNNRRVEIAVCLRQGSHQQLNHLKAFCCGDFPNAFS